MEDGIFISQEGHAKKVLKKFNMADCKPVCTLVECRTKLSKYDEGIIFEVTLISHYMEKLTMTHTKAAKRILCYIKGTLDYGLIYSSSNEFKLVGYSRKSNTGYMFYLGDIVFT
ncbi:uncharacterized protein LOC111386625 [Olea europaea var. sylvestris]|uniref:uncharacterized protein LOC111386625 n=1 Tax=Olea europaea var. sylvestris TaxID=158386 RepID=UPI000C1CD46B|nr:uncharacterized protein LOC111386625 [Olea europaea var. sylvestris]